MITFYKIISYIMIASGIFHSSFTPVFYSSFSKNAIWFIGTGLAASLLGLLNISIIITKDNIVLKMSIIVNIIFVIFFNILRDCS